MLVACMIPQKLGLSRELLSFQVFGLSIRLKYDCILSSTLSFIATSLIIIIIIVAKNYYFSHLPHVQLIMAPCNR